MFLKLPNKCFCDDVWCVFENWAFFEETSIEDVCKFFGLGNNKYIREVGILASPKLTHTSLFTREKDPKRTITEDFLIIIKNKKAENPICLWAVR